MTSLAFAGRSLGELRRCVDSCSMAHYCYSIAIRIGQALGLHKNSCYERIPLFQAEMRRRLWWTLCEIDCGFAMDRGSEILMVKGSFDTILPLHINDEDIWLGGPEEVAEREQFTDMTYRYKVILQTVVF